MITANIVTMCHQSVYNIVDYIPYATYYISMTYLFYDWNFVPLNPFYLLIFHPFPILLSLWQTPLCAL